MSNMYFSNTIGYNKRQPPVPNPVPVQYKGPDLMHNFHPSDAQGKRLVSHTYRASDRNYSHPARTSPIMMTSGVHPIDAHKETGLTENKLDYIKSKADYCLPEQGPAIVPLVGKGGSPIKLADRKPTKETNSLSLFNYRGNLHKETLNLKHHPDIPEPQAQP